MSHPSSSSNNAFLLHPQARRHIRYLVGKTLTYFAQRADVNLKLVREHLLDLLDAGPPPVSAQNLRSAYTQLQQQGEVFNQVFESVFKVAMEQEERLAVPEMLISDAPRYPVPDVMDGMSLSLIDMTEVERILLVDRVVLRFTEYYEASVNPLTDRVAVLLGLKIPSLARNPFRAEVFVRAFLSAWEKCGFDSQATQDLLLALEPMHCLDLTPLYADLNSTLMHAGIKAQTQHHIRKSNVEVSSNVKKGVVAQSAAGAARQQVVLNESAAHENISPTAIRQAQEFLRKLGLDSQPQRGGHAISPESVQIATTDLKGSARFFPADAKFIAYLGQLQVGAGSAFGSQELAGQDPADCNVLRQLRCQPEVRRAPELDRGTLDTLSEVFDFVFSDEALALQMRLVMGRLQIPVLKAAMLDRNFFFSADQPARRLVDTLAAAALAWESDKGESDPLYVRVESAIQRVLNEFEDDVTLFSDLVLEVTEFLFETEQQAQVQITPIAEHERQSELFQQALVHADMVVEDNIASVPPELPLAAFLAPFLRKQWREVMARAWMTVQTDPQQWEQAIAVMEQLIWSTQPKTRTKERRHLVTVLPDLVRKLNTSLDAIEWTGKGRARFTRRLMATHTLAIRMTRTAQTDTGSAPLSEDFSSSATKEQDGHLDDTLIATEGEFDASVQFLTRGMWFDFVIDKMKRQRRCLNWISPLRTRMLFTSRDGGDPLVYSAQEVALLLQTGQLRAIDQKPIVSRALDQIMSDTQRH